MTRHRIAFVVGFLGCLVFPVRGDAQAARGIQLREGRTLDDVKIGARLRVLVQGGDAGDRLEGLLRGFGPTSMQLDVSGSTRDFPMSSIFFIEERYRSRKRAALVGALGAVVLVYVWDFFGPHPRYTDQDQRYKENLQALAIGVPASAAIGYAIGWPRWRPITFSVR